VPDLIAADIVLILVVTFMSVGMAYVHSPRAKSLLYMLPFPFSVALISTGRGLDVTHVLGMLAVWGFPWVVYVLHRKLGLNILFADIAAIVIHTGISLCLAGLLPVQGEMRWGIGEASWFNLLCLFILITGGLSLRFVPHREEDGHKSPLPPWVKGPIVLAIISLLILNKEALRGFMPSFPMVTIFAVYESRKSLFTLASRFPICLIGFMPMVLVIRALVPYENPTLQDYLIGLGVAWACYIPIYLLLDRFHNAKRAAEPDELVPQPERIS
jgi:hypothetical protein